MSATTSPSTPAPAPPQEPRRELLGRYKAVFSEVWQRRHEMAGPARLADETAFLPAALSLQETPPHPAPRRVIWAVISLFCIALLWACFGQVDIVAVAPGRIEVSEGTKLVQPLEASVVKAIHVKDGDKVKAGDVLIELDPTMAQADSSRVTQERAGALSETWRTQALLAAFTAKSSTAPTLPQAFERSEVLTGEQRIQAKAQLDAEWQDLQAQRAKLQADIVAKRTEIDTVREQITKLNTTLPLLQKREDDFNELSKQGFVSQHAGQDRTRARIEMQQDLATYRARHEETKAALQQAEQARSAWVADTINKLNERHAKADLQQRQLAQDASKATQRERLTRLTAPTTGTVQQLAVHTTGGVVTPAQVLMVVVPEQAEVTAEVTLENKDIGFVNAGQAVEVKLETFPFTRYGTVPATVSSITADAVVRAAAPPKSATDAESAGSTTAPAPGGAVFPATVKLHVNHIDVDGKSIKLSPGMNVTAEIKTGRRRVIEYLLSPVQTYASESLRER
ncbi:HlyD family type I secretion periplasmic adaptor subunit [Aquabacterium sp.]|uniref:HlyD family type I secretion periplasmic adaptor subunit n=1 Tax=Aquabacterium sp. TaxID=1872578 RepID=UPI003D6C7112